MSLSGLSLPDDYSPLGQLNLCGNVLKNVEIPFQIDGGAPLLIGRGDGGGVDVWLSARAASTAGAWTPLVRKGVSLHRSISIKKDDKSVSVKLKNKTIVLVQIDESGTPSVVFLDLRPIGLNIRGTEKELVVGTNRLVSNTFENVKVMVGVGVGV